MKITNKIIMDLQRSNSTPMIAAVQTDCYSRQLEIELQDEGLPFLPPTNAEFLIRYRRIDGTGGEYNTLTDGNPAWTISGNHLTIVLVPQIFSYPGTVSVSVTIISSGIQLSSFPIEVYVSSLSRPTGSCNGDAPYVTGLLPSPEKAQVGQWLQVCAVDSLGRVIGLRAATNIPKDGYTPIRGLDYWTTEDKAAIEADIERELAKREQLKPEFANSIEECSDITKLYVLPDGYIYGYMMTQTTTQQTLNGLSLAVDTDGSPYNSGQGFKDNYRLNSSGVESEFGGMDVTGFIPIQVGDIITITGAKAGGNTAYFHYYKDDFSWLGSAASDKTDGEAPNITLKVTNETAGYFRFTANLNSAVITITRLVHVADAYAWANTGHAFVPADYEGRIVALEKAASDHSTRVAALEGRNVPDFVIAEAEAVIDRVINAQGNRTFTFAAISDLHYGNGENTDGVEHACQALRFIDDRIGLDTVAVLGDITDSMGTTNQSETIADLKAVNSLLKGFSSTPTLRIMGNHDFIGRNDPKTVRLITSFNKEVIWGDRLGGYFYRDFPEYKLRIIAVNCCEKRGNALDCSNKQYNWFADALDMSEKSDVEQWQTLILSHMPLDWFAHSGSYIFHKILKAYLTSGSYVTSDGSVSCNFAGKKQAKIIGNIHGHIHNFLTRNIADGQPNTTQNTIDVLRISTPEACQGRENQYRGQWDFDPFGEETDYPKTPGTAKDTAFCVYCIDLDEHTIHAVCYGAGYDRTLQY